VVFPGEQLNLHIFEPKYKQLIQGVFSAKKNVWNTNRDSRTIWAKWEHAGEIF
jgi:Lon protease-like protein